MLQKSEREKPHSGKTKSQSTTKAPCNQPAIAIRILTQKLIYSSVSDVIPLL